MKKYILIFCSIFTLFPRVFGECPLSTVPSPPIQKWEANVDAIISEVKALSGSDTKCSKPAGYPSHLDVAIPIRSVHLLTGYMQATGQSIESLISDIRFYFDNAGMTMPIELEHQKTILEIQGKIIEAGIYIGGRCTQDKKFEKDISIPDSVYKTKGRSIQAVLADLSSQNTEVLKFFRNLVKNVQSREYIDEAQFLMAPKGFAKEMTEFYSAEALQKCHDEDPKNQAITKALKDAFTVGWKYPQAVQIWKDAFAMLLYRSKQLVGAGETDPAKEAEIKNLVEAQKGGIGNSKFLINSQFFKEFGRRASNQTVIETLKDAGKRIAYEVFGPLFRRQVVGDITSSNESRIYTNLVRYAQENQNAKELAELDRSQYDAYALRKVYVGQNKEQDPLTVTGLVQALEELGKARPTIEENVDLACNDVLNKQAQNIPHPDCQEFMKG